MKVLIVDDEPIAQQILEKLSEKVNYLTVEGVYDNAITALEAIQESQPDLIFLDIQMPEMTGLEMLRIFRQKDILVILTTAYHEYALESYELDVVDYLLKPIAFERFLKAVTKANELYKLKRASHPASVATFTGNDAKTYVWAKEGRKRVQICLEDIILVQALKDYMELQMPAGKVILNVTMNKIEELLPPPFFLRVNRSCIVRKSAIKHIQDMHIEIILPSIKRIPIGPTYWEDVKKHIVELF
ncbi:two component transcriptional regulator, LytTR family [Filimonas lacunae]|uniref:Two component transcriptional regulator, LytTR family n=1 Tax=Filimonas lacunae TaxID=477680 RepID=A0A173MBK3_9BACT|nr:response regulator transcription factor [Filimonas lacunae]BAV04879.1 two-component system response regulator [Filimonas lacunae]SIT34620.1 two component transcriptional regulator, LytTR family [Filimonas lacunae]